MSFRVISLSIFITTILYLLCIMFSVILPWYALVLICIGSYLFSSWISYPEQL
jgi:hypothetical protein